MNLNKRLFLIGIFCVLSLSVLRAEQGELGKNAPSLAEKYKDTFMIGTFVSQVFYKDVGTALAGRTHWVSPNTSASSEDLFLKQFNQSTTGNSLKPEGAHPFAPPWLVKKYPAVFRDVENYRTANNRDEWDFQLPDFIFGKAVANNLYIHGHSLAWYQQSAAWLARITPADVPAANTASRSDGTYMTNGQMSNNGADLNHLGPTPKIAVSKDDARRVLFDHVAHEMRHYSANTISVHSWDVLNEEINDGWANNTIAADRNAWKPALRNTSWLRAMMDSNDWAVAREHYVYLLFKFAHIAVPNDQMAARFAQEYAHLPEYLKMNGGSNNGDLSKYVQKVNGQTKTPILYFNDYNLNNANKARVTYNMVKELNEAWKTDPLYDGRALIEAIGLQAHYSVSPELLGQVRAALELFETLSDVQSGAVKLAISELDMKSTATSPGGRQTAPGSQNVGGCQWTQEQADAQGYQFALLFKLFAEHSRYIERVTLGGLEDRVNWLWNNHGHTVLFDQDMCGNPGYYGAYDPDTFIAEHTYLASYFGQ
ncbi:MAG: endo-1,4-beta-xylanase [Treponema sp.]|jgi:GH35 family endo-1,4-beta-xylanase|nr:endo-1,4-beta-xylanase [Treponema sp.]